jgi:hypothetical protein
MAVMAATLLSSAAVTVLPGTAQAAVPPFGLCRYSGTNPTIDIRSFLTPAYQSALGAGMSRWNDSSAAGVFRWVSSGANIDA